MIAHEGSEIFVSDTLGDAGIGLQIKKVNFLNLKICKNFFLSKLNTPTSNKVRQITYRYC